MFTRAIVRKPGENFADGITTATSQKPDYRKALKQHKAYCDALKYCGVDVTVLEADLDYPDGCYVEDTAIVTEEMAVITKPGNHSRFGEQDKIAEQLVTTKKLEYIFNDGRLDGGDVMRVGKHFYIGRSNRTNAEGAEQLAIILKKYGYTSSEIPVKSVLHLKTGITHLKDNYFISIPEFKPYFKKKEVIEVASDEGYMANCLFVNHHLITPQGYPKTSLFLENLGIKSFQLNMSEFKKMDGGLTCLSLLF